MSRSELSGKQDRTQGWMSLWKIKKKKHLSLWIIILIGMWHRDCNFLEKYQLTHSQKSGQMEN
jgi:hypothetical protein